MTDPGASGRQGRHSIGDGPGGVPPFYWISTDGRGSDGRSDAPGQVDPQSGSPRYGSPRYGSPRYDGPQHDIPHYGVPRYEDSRYDVPRYDVPRYDVPRYDVPRYDVPRYDATAWSSGGSAWAADGAGRHALGAPGESAEPTTAGFPHVPGLSGRHSDDGGTAGEPAWWRQPDGRSERFPDSGGSQADRSAWASDRSAEPPGSDPGGAPTPPPPPPPGVWERLQRREGVAPEDQETAAHPLGQGDPAGTRPGQHPAPTADIRAQGDDTDAYAVDPHHLDPDDDPDPDPSDAHEWEDRTGGLEVIGAHVEEDIPRQRRWRRGRAAGYEEHDPSPDHGSDAAVDHGHPDDPPFEHGAGWGHAGTTHGRDPGDEEIPIAPYDPRQSRARRRRRPIAVLVSLVVLAGLVFGIVVGGQALLGMIDPSSRDYSGQGTGSVEIRVRDGDTLSDIARTLVDAGVIASTGPFVEAAESEAAATGIQPGVYAMRQQMSGQAALDLLLDPVARMVTRVTVPEGRTVKATLALMAESTGTPIEELEAAAADPAALGLPAYANGQLEGFLFPATYDVEPGTAPADMLRQMVLRADQALDGLQIPEEQRLEMLTKASIVQAEASSAEDMAMVARVVENRLADGMPLQMDSTVNYASGKSGITTTPEDRANPSPYNTYVHPGLTPGPIGNPGEDALRAVQSPTPGDWLYFVVVDPDTGDTRFAVTGEEHQQNVLLFQQWLREQPDE